MTACQSLTTVELIQAAILARDDVETMLVIIIFLISRSFQKYVTTYGLQLKKYERCLPYLTYFSKLAVTFLSLIKTIENNIGLVEV